jgi:hypothetical protein
MSAGLSEKYATSEPDIKADIDRRIIRTIKPVNVLKSGVLTVIPERNMIFVRKFPGSNFGLFC